MATDEVNECSTAYILVNNLVHSINEDKYPRDEPTLKTFLFMKCRSLEELANMLSVYTDIVKINPNFKKKDLVSAVEEHRLLSYIISMYKQKKEYTKSYHFSWFKLNIERWLTL